MSADLLSQVKSPKDHIYKLAGMEQMSPLRHDADGEERDGDTTGSETERSSDAVTASSCSSRDASPADTTAEPRASVIVDSRDVSGGGGDCPDMSSVVCGVHTHPKPYMRFRYSSEYKDNRTAHRLLGSDSSPAHVTYPAIYIRGWRGPAIVVVTLVQADNYTRLHSHSLVLANSEKEGETAGCVKYKVFCKDYGTIIEFKDLCLIRNKKEALKQLPMRYQRIDPFRVGYNALADSRSYNSHAVRLCFQVFLLLHGTRFRLNAFVSNVIKNRGPHQTLKIINVAFCAPVDNTGLRDVLILCDKVDKEDVSVELVTKACGQWEVVERFRPDHVVSSAAITVRMSDHLLSRVHNNTYVRLKRLSTDECSDLFRFTPLHPAPPPPPHPAPCVNLNSQCFRHLLRQRR